MHDPEEVAQHRLGGLGAPAGGLQGASEDAPVEQPRVLGEQTEDQPIQEVRDPVCVVVAVAQFLGEARESAGGALGDVLGREAGAQPLGIGEGPPENLQVLGLGQLLQRDLMDRRDRVRPVRVDDDLVHVGTIRSGGFSSAGAYRCNCA
ncbi:MAG: hypothetical protein LC121_17695 [Anaerolineae bacterium]|nr:hypothetical protein [Anaerolineae bacterium]